MLPLIQFIEFIRSIIMSLLAILKTCCFSENIEHTLHTWIYIYILCHVHVDIHVDVRTYFGYSRRPRSTFLHIFCVGFAAACLRWRVGRYECSCYKHHRGTLEYFLFHCHHKHLNGHFGILLHYHVRTIRIEQSL